MIAKVTQVLDSGAVVELEQDLEAFVPRSEMAQEKFKHPTEIVTIGDTIEAKVILTDIKERKIHLSIRQLDLELQREAEKNIP